MKISNGTLNVNGDYTLTYTTHYDEGDEIEKLDNTGKLHMNNSALRVNITGDFHTYSEQYCSNGTSYNYFNKGTMTICGNLYQHSGSGLDDGHYNSNYSYQSNFQPASIFKIIFAGNTTHIFSSKSASTTTGTIEPQTQQSPYYADGGY